MALTKVSRGLLTTSIVDNGNDTAITIDSSENVGIGVSNPSDYYATNLVVVAGSEGGITIASDSSANNGYLMFADSSSGTDRYAGLISYEHSTDNMVFRTNSVERIRIDSVGNVEMRGSANVRISLGTAGTSGSNNNSNWIYGNGTNLRFNNAGGFYSWEILGTERLRITNAGKLVVNGTIAGYSGTDITVGSPSQGTAGLSILSSTTGNGYLLFGDATGDATGGYSGQLNYNHSTNKMGFTTNNVERFAIDSVGAIFATGVRSSSAANNDLRYNTSNGEIYYQTSSERYKSNIVDLEFDTSNLYNLRPVSFDDNETGERCFGLIAEDTFDQIPEAVVTRNIDGETVPDSIPYSMLSVLIINEMKNLKAENDSLRSRIEALENN